MGVLVTTLTGTTGAVVRFYTQRGTVEQWITEGTEATPWTRLSCPRVRAHAGRGLVGVGAYTLGTRLRRLVLPLAIQRGSQQSLQQRLVTTGGRLLRPARYCILHLAERHLTPRVFGQILGRIERLTGHPT